MQDEEKKKVDDDTRETITAMHAAMAFSVPNIKEINNSIKKDDERK